MDIRRMSLLDRWIGVPSCWLLTAVRYVTAAVGAARPPSPVRRICVIKLIEQGSTVLAADALRRCIATVGQENVFFAVFSENRPILDLLGLIRPENVIEIRTDSVPRLALDFARAIWRLRRLRVDATIDLEFFARGTAIFAFLSGASRRVGYHRFRNVGGHRGDLMTHRVQYTPYLHASQSFSLLVDVLQEPEATHPMSKRRPPALDPSATPFFPRPEDHDVVARLLREVRVDTTQHDLILLNPNAGDLMPLRKWPSERYVELGRRLLARHPRIRIAVTGNQAEAEHARAVAAAIDGERAASLAGRTSLEQLLTLYAVARVLVTNDSGPAQFAALTPIHSVVLFGPETPLLYAPLSERTITISAGVACSPCLNVFNYRLSPCSNNVCMQQISVDQVVQAVEGCLTSSAASTALPLQAVEP